MTWPLGRPPHHTNSCYVPSRILTIGANLGTATEILLDVIPSLEDVSTFKVLFLSGVKLKCYDRPAESHEILMYVNTFVLNIGLLSVS